MGSTGFQLPTALVPFAPANPGFVPLPDAGPSFGVGGGPGGSFGTPGPRDGEGILLGGGAPAGGEMVLDARGAWLPLVLGGEITLGREDAGGEMSLGEFE